MLDDNLEQWFHNHYKCPCCGCEWSDVWTSESVENDCPSCGARHLTAVQNSEPIGQPSPHWGDVLANSSSAGGTVTLVRYSNLDRWVLWRTAGGGFTRTTMSRGEALGWFRLSFDWSHVAWAEPALIQQAYPHLTSDQAEEMLRLAYSGVDVRITVETMQSQPIGSCYLCDRPIRAEHPLLRGTIDPENERIGHVACIRARGANCATIREFSDWLSLIRDM